MADKVVVGSDLTPDRLKKFEGVLGEITRQLVQGLHSPGKGLSLEQGQAFVEHRNTSPTQASSVSPQETENSGISPYVSNLLNPEAFIADWREFYRQVHSMKVDPSGLMKRLPPVTSGFSWGVWVLKGTTPQRAYEMCQAMFPCWKWCGDRSLDEVIDFTKEVRTAQKRQYFDWCKARVEADDELKNTSALQIAERQINTLNLTEPLLLHQWFYWKSGGKHLDVRNVTRCDGSRYSDGSVPSVHWSGFSGKLVVSRYVPGDANDNLRSRQAVS